MSYQMEVYSSLCALRLFDINGIPANSYDFGEQTDVSPETAEDYCCGNMRFTRYEVPQEGVLTTYGITLEDYEAICSELEDTLSFGACGWCS